MIVLKWIVTNWQFCVICGLLMSNLGVAVFHGLRLKRRAQAEMAALENRLKHTASVQKHLGSTWAERYAALKEQKRG